MEDVVPEDSVPEDSLVGDRDDTSSVSKTMSRHSSLFPPFKTTSCTQDTGGTCYISKCYAWRKHATCSSGKCLCPSGMCAYQGSCIAPARLPSAPPPPVCQMKTGGTCRFSGCASWRKAECTGFSFGFSSGFTLGQCVCTAGTCAKDGKCVPSPELTKPPKVLEAKKIVCPVLASLFNAGIFKTDEYGRVERQNLQDGITNGLGASSETGKLFGVTTAGYTKADSRTELSHGVQRR